MIRSDDLTKSMSQYLVDRIEADPAITVRNNTVVVALDGDESLEVVQLRGAQGECELECKALFSFIGADPASSWLSGCAALDDRGFALTDAALTEDLLGETWAGLGRGPLPFETSHPGLFAVGDLRSESVKRVASAVGEGSAAVRAVHQHLAFIS